MGRRNGVYQLLCVSLRGSDIKCSQLWYHAACKQTGQTRAAAQPPVAGPTVCNNSGNFEQT
ncbi:MAG: hypothetical protein Hals2KO_03530 [Halioglobus sp.]